MSNDLQPSTFQKALKIGKELLQKGLCVLDDIPFLLQMKELGNLGSYILAGAGFIIFPAMFGFAIKDILKARRKFREERLHANAEKLAVAATKRNATYLASAGKIALSVIGLGVTASLLAFVLVNFSILAAAASIAIPTIMAIVSGIELSQDGHSLSQAKLALKRAQQANDPEAITNAQTAIQSAKRNTNYSAAFMGFSLAITALATVSVLSGLGVMSLGVIPSAVLVGVVVTALALKIFQIVDKKKGFAMSNAIKKGINNIFGTDFKLSLSVRPLVDDQDTNKSSRQDSTFIQNSLANSPTTQRRTSISALAPSESERLIDPEQKITPEPKQIIGDISDNTENHRSAFPFGFGSCAVQ